MEQIALFGSHIQDRLYGTVTKLIAQGYIAKSLFLFGVLKLYP